ncbi:flagellar biosynthesis regulator FlaF [Sulfitobacter donghicola]|uniref:flagellar biosynthesis regulator FlaF n=1 Tax=Sulfitobacter donghicola TaxID=421000 RepID=UPI0005688306|nr:flagellar biosynthesis regulator FlaF [Sulfitobacter donghicola]KIN67805.1 Flagellar protein [Sulfitobacter donghicola DSW-25 = KCTC 12864 = JCM 14565]
MNATTLAQKGYAPIAAPLKSARKVEFDVVARITSRLSGAMKEKDFNKLIEAMHENRTLWRKFGLDASSPQNLLPEDLRARIIYLAEFTEHHTRKAIRGQASALPLVEVNTAILRGLK